ncbi:MAG: LPS export ABC transporter periplasmic protein LptC [Balneola sp.]|jgi:LPS export ABC transporter protein LptC|nr:LPS export ABC transporter periplasmic protein LptC [Balneola sp.]MBE80245.1 LPS export ABC transporter periplasmic protein LptC [Balneola sp.]HBX65525.1 LPS export ABC transporter periplasmic protein LptC [Balneolaceae bacterium]|tara:strand:- start:673 stop:1227 length:555 start_codon:yes stop_codon:yes gene_type:complete
MKNIHLFLLPIFLLPLTTSCGELTEFENKQVQEALSDSLFTTTESWGIDMEVLENGKLKLKLSGSYAASIKDESRNLTKISGPVYIEIFDEEGKPDTFVNADSAVHKPQDSEFELFGNVRVDAPGGKKLQSDYLKWERQRDRVSTPEFVIFISPPDSIAAQGFFGDSDLNNYTLNEGGGRAVIE